MKKFSSTVNACSNADANATKNQKTENSRTAISALFAKTAKNLTALVVCFAMAALQAVANEPVYTITGTPSGFEVHRDVTLVNGQLTTIADAIILIRNNADREDCTIHFDLNSFPASPVEFSNDGESMWGNITLTGTIETITVTSPTEFIVGSLEVAGITNNGGVLHITGDGVIGTNKSLIAINNFSGSLKISGRPEINGDIVIHNVGDPGTTAVSGGAEYYNLVRHNESRVLAIQGNDIVFQDQTAVHSVSIAAIYFDNSNPIEIFVVTHGNQTIPASLEPKANLNECYDTGKGWFFMDNGTETPFIFGETQVTGNISLYLKNPDFYILKPDDEILFGVIGTTYFLALETSIERDCWNITFDGTSDDFGDNDYSFLPSGLEINNTSQAGIFEFKITAKFNDVYSPERAITIIIKPRIDTIQDEITAYIDNEDLADGKDFDFPFAAKGSISEPDLTSLLWSVSDEDAAKLSTAGLVLSDDGVLSGKLSYDGSEGGEVSFTIRAALADAPDVYEEATFTIVIMPQPVTNIEILNVNGGQLCWTEICAVVGDNLTISFGADGSKPLSWEVMGLIENSYNITADGVLTLQATGNLSFSVVAKNDANKQQGTRGEIDIVITVHPKVEIQTENLPSGVVGREYLFNVGTEEIDYNKIFDDPQKDYAVIIETIATDDNAQWEEITNVLSQRGLQLSSEGIIVGEISGSGDITFTARAFNAASSEYREFTVKVYEVPEIDEDKLNLSFKVGDEDAKFAFALTNKDNTTAEITWNMYPDNVFVNTGLAFNPETGIISGIPTDVTAHPVQFTLTAKTIVAGIIHSSKPVEFTFEITDVLRFVACAPLSDFSTMLEYGIVGKGYDVEICSNASTFDYTVNWLPWEGESPVKGLLFESGTISGTPTEVGIFKFDIMLELLDNGDQVDLIEEEFTIIIYPKLEINDCETEPCILLEGTAKEPYSYTFGIVDDIESEFGNVTWSIIGAGTFPDGLVLDPGSGKISGIPTEDGHFTFTVKAIHSHNNVNGIQEDEKEFTIIIRPEPVPPVITTTSLPHGIVGNNYIGTLTATGDATITWEITDGDLPNGLSLNESTGEISGMPTEFGVFTFDVTAENDAGEDTETFTIIIYPKLEIIAECTGDDPTCKLKNGEIDDEYNAILTTSVGNNFGTVEWESNGLPTDWEILPTGVISGIPTTAGKFTFSVTATHKVEDAVIQTATRQFSIEIEKKTPPALTTISFIAEYGKTLSDFTLQPEGWIWENPNESVGNVAATPNKHIAMFNETVDFKSGSVEVDITVEPKNLTIQLKADASISKVHDGNTAIALTELAGKFEFVGLVLNETAEVDVSGVTASFENSYVGEDKFITFTGVFAIGNGSASSSNYTIVPASEVSDITGSITDSYIIEVDKTKLSFEPREYGYGQQNLPPVLEFILSNTGTGAVNFSWDIHPSFQLIDAPNSIEPLLGGNNVTFKVSPIVGLGVGTHTADLTITATYESNVSADGSPAFVVLEFTVGALHDINIAQSENGTVTASSNSATKDATVELTVVPNEGFELDKIVVTYDGIIEEIDVIPSGENKYTFKMPDNEVTVTATFKKKTYNVAVVANPTDAALSITTFNAPVEHGEKISVTVMPDVGYKFVGWYVGDVKIDDTSKLEDYEVLDNVTIVAKFELITYNVTLAANPQEGGTVSADIYNPTLFHALNITAKANEGYEFVNWTDTETGIDVSEDENHLIMMIIISGDVNLTANFKLKTYTVAAEVSPIGSGNVSVSDDGQIEHGKPVTLTAMPTDGNEFLHWSLEGSNETYDANPLVIAAVTSDMTFTAHFDAEILTYEVAVSVLSNQSSGSVTVSPDGKQIAGTPMTLTVLPATNWQLGDIIAYNTGSPATTVELSGSGATRKFTMPAYDVTVEATFVQLFNVTVSSSGATGVSGSGHNAVGATVNINAGTRSGMVFVRWTSTQASLEFEDINSAITSFTMPASDVNVSAGWGYTVTVNDDGNGVATTSHDKQIQSQQVTLTATPHEGYSFNRFTPQSGTGLNMLSGDANNSASFNMPNSNVVYLAEFTPIPYAIAITQSVGGTIISNPAQTATIGTNVSINANLAENYEFVRWIIASNNSADVEIEDANNPQTTFKMPASNVSISAEYQYIPATPVQFDVQLFAIPVDGGTFLVFDADGNHIYSNIDGAFTLNYDEGYIFEAIANSGWKFVNWTIAYVEDGIEYNDEYDDEAIFEFAMEIEDAGIYSDIRFYANFEEDNDIGSPDTYIVSIFAVPAEGGSIAVTDEFSAQISGDSNSAFTLNYDEGYMFEAIANSGWKFVNWTIAYIEDGIEYNDEYDDEAMFEFAMEIEDAGIYSDIRFYANFEENNIVTPGDYNVVISTNTTDGGSFMVINTYGYPVLGSPEGVFEFNTDEEYIIIATASPGWKFINWSIFFTEDGITEFDTHNNAQLEIELDNDDLAWISNIRLVANFVDESLCTIPINFTLSAQPSEGGLIIGGDELYTMCDLIELEAIENEGWIFVGWILNGVQLSVDDYLSIPAFMLDGAILTALFEAEEDEPTDPGAPGEPPTQISNVESPVLSTPLRAWIRDGLFHISGLTIGEPLRIYSSTGAMVYSDIANSSEIDLGLKVPFGMYIIQSGNQFIRIIYEY